MCEKDKKCPTIPPDVWDQPQERLLTVIDQYADTCWVKRSGTEVEGILLSL